MAKVKNKGSKIEKDFSKALRNAGFRYRKNVGKYFGKPDFVLKKYQIVIFVDSCFWHGCKKHCRLPTTRRKFWTMKIGGNKRRDKEVNRYYRKIKWHIIRIWEHNLKKKNLNLIFDE